MSGPGPLARWVAQVSAEFGLDVDGERATRLVLDLARDVAHRVDRPAAPVTAYLLGLAAASEAAREGAAAAVSGTTAAMASEAMVGDVAAASAATDATERAAARVRALLADWPADGGA
jgi:hypothetical protein